MQTNIMILINCSKILYLHWSLRTSHKFKPNSKVTFVCNTTFDVDIRWCFFDAVHHVILLPAIFLMQLIHFLNILLLKFVKIGILHLLILPDKFANLGRSVVFTFSSGYFEEGEEGGEVCGLLAEERFLFDNRWL